MNKKIFLLLFLTCILLTPTITVDARLQKTVMYRCRCVNKRSGLSCNNCDVSTISRKLNEKCGQGGELGEIKYACGFVPGSTPEEACGNNLSLYNRYGHMNVTGLATCKGGPNQHIGDGFCDDAGAALRFLGYLILYAKILVPFIIILMGTMDIYKAMTSHKDDELKQQLKNFGKRILIGMIIFFLPTLLNVFLLLFGDSVDLGDFEGCRICLLTPGDCQQ